MNAAQQLGESLLIGINNVQNPEELPDFGVCEMEIGFKASIRCVSQ